MMPDLLIEEIIVLAGGVAFVALLVYFGATMVRRSYK